MRKSFLSVLLLFSCSAFASGFDWINNSPVQPIKPIAEKTIELKGALSGTLEKSTIAIMQEQINEALNDDRLIAFYLTIPYEKRQYLFPQIHASPYISHKVKTHPEIIVWKNKTPTIIAPHLKEFAQKHLKNLHPHYYQYMDPEFWQTQPKEEDNQLISEKLIQDPAPLLDEKGLDYVYPTLREIFKLSKKESQEYFKTTLTLDDLAHFSDVVTHLDQFKPQNFDKELLLAFVVEKIKDQYYRSIGDPFLMYYFTLDTLKEKETFDAFVQKHGFKDGLDFALKADKITKAYNALSLHLFSATYIAQYKTDRKIKQPTQSDFGTPDIAVMDMYTRKYTIKPSDAYFIQKHKEQLAPLLKTNFIEHGIMFLVD